MQKKYKSCSATIVRMKTPSQKKYLKVQAQFLTNIPKAPGFGHCQGQEQARHPFNLSCTVMAFLMCAPSCESSVENPQDEVTGLSWSMCFANSRPLAAFLKEHDPAQTQHKTSADFIQEQDQVFIWPLIYSDNSAFVYLNKFSHQKVQKLSSSVFS